MKVATGFVPVSRKLLAPCAALALSLLGCGDLDDPGEGGTTSGALTTHEQLLQRWAPIHYQDVNNKGTSQSLNGRSDFIMRVDYEAPSNAGDHFNAWDKWDNLPAAGNDLRGFMYGDVTESDSHWFLYYMAYHPRDWQASGRGTVHENDAEGVVLFIRKNGSPFGEIEGMISDAHGIKQPYTANHINIVARNGTVIPIQWEWHGDWRPRTYQEAEGHGFYGCGQSGTKCDKRDEDGIRYVPSFDARAPGPIGVWSTVQYAIRPMSELWNRRREPLLFNQSTRKFNGNTSGGCGEQWLLICATSDANPMWQWEHDIATNPAAWVQRYFEFRNVPPPSNHYIKNNYTVF